jgi:hypothetical protein
MATTGPPTGAVVAEQAVTALGSVTVPLVPLGTGLLKGASVVMSGSLGTNNLFHVALTSADGAATYWRLGINAAVAGPNPDVHAELLNNDLLRDLPIDGLAGLITVANGNAPNLLLSFTVVVA